MKWIKYLGIGLVLIGAVDSCIKEPSYDVIPQISLESLVFKKGDISKTIDDTLIIKIHFKDGDGDLGIGAEDALLPEYQTPVYWAYNTTDFSLINGTDKSAPLPTGYKLLQYKDRKLSAFASLPDIHECQYWEGSLNDSNLTDTLYITQNLKAFNINVDFSIKNTSTGKYEPFDPRVISKNPLLCNYNIFRKQFPDLSNDRKSAPLDGTITYRIESLGLYNQFNGKTLKLEVTIYDRAFHASPSTPSTRREGFTLQQITK